MLCLNERIHNTKLAKWVTTQLPSHRLINKVYSTVYSFREKKGALVKAITISFLAHLPLIVGMYCIGQGIAPRTGRNKFASFRWTGFIKSDIF